MKYNKQRPAALSWSNLLRSLVGATWLIAILSLPSASHEIDPSLDLPLNPRFPFPVAKNVDLEPLVPKTADPLAPKLDPRDEPPVSPVTPEPYPVFFGEEIGSYKLILVVDVSGSMFPGRLKVAQAEATRMVEAFSKNIIFDIVTFAQTDQRGSQFEVLWSHTSEEHEGMRPATAENKLAAIAFINRNLPPNGNTPTFQGVKAALDFLRNPRVVLLTDGAPSSWVDWKVLEFDPRGQANMVPGIPSIGGGEPQNMAAGVDDQDPSTSIAGPMRQQWYMICRENHIIRPAKQSFPARIDVFGVIDYNEPSHNVKNMKWFCRRVANDNFGQFTELSIPN
jgi:hypothetical protein